MLLLKFVEDLEWTFWEEFNKGLTFAICGVVGDPVNGKEIERAGESSRYNMMPRQPHTAYPCSLIVSTYCTL